MLRELTTESQVVAESSRSTSDKSLVTAAKGGAILFAGELFAYITGFLFSIVIARFLGAEQFGVYRLSLTITTIVAAICYMGLDGGLVKFLPIAVGERNENRVWGIIQVGVGLPLFLSLVLTLIFIFIAEPLSSEIFKKPSLASVFRLLCLAIPLTVLTGSLSSVVKGFKQVQYDVYSQNITFQLMKLLLSVSFLILGMGVLGVAVAYLIATGAATVMLLYFVNHIFVLRRPLIIAERNTREIFNFSFPLYLARLLNQFGRNLETLVLGLLGVLLDVGVYAAILRLSQIGTMGLDALQKISEPIISELHSHGKKAELARLYQTTTKWALTFNLPIFLTIVLFAENLLSIFGKDFAMGTAGLIILSAGILFKASTGFCGTVINMTGYTKLGFFNSIVYFVTTILLDFILISRWQLIGAACAGALTIIIVNTLRTMQVYVLFDGLLPFNRSFSKPLIATLVAATLTYAFSRLFLLDSPLIQLLILAPILWILYVAVIVLLKLSEEDRMILNKLRSRFKTK